MGKSMSELGLKSAPATGVDYDSIPEEYGGPRTPPPYPGDYGFKLPGDLTKAWDVFEDAEKVQWVSLVFDSDNPLTVSQAKDESVIGTEVNLRINNKPRNRGKEKIPVSDMTYLIRVLNPAAKPGAGVKDQAKMNQAVITEVNRHAGKEFLANLEWQTNCSTGRDAYFQEIDPQTEQPTGKTVKRELEGGAVQQGCGARYYMNDWPKVDGKYAPSLTCSCGANLNPFPQLTRFRALVR